MLAYLSTLLGSFSQPVHLIRHYDRHNIRPDLIAGITVAVILLPQAIAFALLAELPPQMGLFTAILGAAVGALWGSSNQVHTGPANALSLLIFSVLMASVEPGSQRFVLAAGLLAVMAGSFQLVLGLAHLGVLVHFVSHSVVVGFASGAGILIAIGQLRHLLGLSFQSHNVLETIGGLATHVTRIHPESALLGAGTLVVIFILTRISPRAPAALVGLVGATAVVVLLSLDERGVVVIGELPRQLPPLADLPLLDLRLIARLSSGALAVGAIGLVQTSAIGRAIAARTGQRLDSNQEFIGQGLANIFCGLFSGYPCAGSFSRSAVNTSAGARTPFAAIFSSLFVALALFTLAPFAANLPRASLAAVLVWTGLRLVDRKEMVRIVQGVPGDALIMVATLLGTLLLELEFAVLLGILLSFAIYIMRTSAPRVFQVIPDEDYNHLVHRPDHPLCPQMGILELMGDLYFGAVTHVENTIYDHLKRYPEQRYLVLRMHHVQQLDFTGIHMLESVMRAYREKGGDLYLMQVRRPVLELMHSSGFDRHLGADHFLDDDNAIHHMFYRVLDPAVCIYECGVRVFKECLNLPKPDYTLDIPVRSAAPEGGWERISPKELWKNLHSPEPMRVIDLREPREFRQGHIVGAELIPLPLLLTGERQVPQEGPIVFACRTGRRSARAASYLLERGHADLRILDGGMLAWESAGLLEAVEQFPPEEDAK